MFMKKGLVVLVYVDDVLFFGTTDAIIDEMIANLKRDFDLKVKKDVFAFLDIEIIRDKKGNAISLRRRGLIDRIIQATGDFAGLWGIEEPQDPTCVKFRTGYLIRLGGCPII